MSANVIVQKPLGLVSGVALSEARFKAGGAHFEYELRLQYCVNGDFLARDARSD